MKIDEKTFRPGPENDVIFTIYRTGTGYDLVRFGERGKHWSSLTAAEAQTVLDTEFFE